MTLRQLLNYGTDRLSAAISEDSAYDAGELLCGLLDISKTQYLLRLNEETEKTVFEDYEKLINRRLNGEPLQYIIGKWSFYGLDFYVGDGVLIPRPETEQLTDICINSTKTKKIKTVFDLCAGSGCIGISIAYNCPETEVFLIEKYEEAARYCRRNIEANGVKNAHLVIADIFDGVPEALPSAGMIVSNPPYVTADEIKLLQKEVGFEPVSALDGGADGMNYYRFIAENWLNENTVFCAFECGEGQSEAIKKMLSSVGEAAVIKDMYGFDRFVCLDK